jgi:putative hydrolase of the HAD superfamily
MPGKKTSNIKLISLDLYRTLIDVDCSLPQVWKVFLGDTYTPELGAKYWARATEIVINNLTAAALNNHEFKNARAIYVDTYTTLFAEIHLDFDPEEAASVLIRGHQVDRLFDDVRPFLKSIREKYRVCLSTDADTEMLTGIGNIFPFDHIFISEELQAYKHNPQFFQQVIDYYKVNPENILHIGDSYHDILTPKQLGIVTCWLNRQNRPWQHEVKPDFEVKSLAEVLKIL